MTIQWALAEAGDLRELGTRALPWVIVVFAALFVLGRAVRVSRYIRGPRADPAAGGKTPWSLQQLREMHAREELDDTEFELLKARAIADASDRQLWTLAELRDMHARGELADDEFAVAKARLIAAVNPGAGAGKEAEESPDPGTPT
ncbi:MAG: SHOCT domain-containing protein [Planctomycetota bacterium]